MLKNKIVAVSILDWVLEANLSQKIKEILDSGADWIHYDIMDGIFVERKTQFNNSIIEAISKVNAHYVDFHLMVDDPSYYLNLYRKIASSMTFHFEAVSYNEAHRLIKQFKSPKTKIGISINPKTNIEQIYEYLQEIDMILVMSVIPGMGGQSFIPETLEKVSRIKKYIDQHSLKTIIQVDGGINNTNSKKIFDAGADVIVSGSYITRSTNFASNIDELKK